MALSTFDSQDLFMRRRLQSLILAAVCSELHSWQGEAAEAGAAVGSGG